MWSINGHYFTRALVDFGIVIQTLTGRAMRLWEQRKAARSAHAPRVLPSGHGSIENREMLYNHAIGR
jgi:hypothetical protein